MTTGQKIKNARQNLGYTQEQLAEQLSVSRQAIAKWESDRGVPDIENLKAIASFIDCSVDDLINNDILIGQETELEITPASNEENYYGDKENNVGTVNNSSSGSFNPKKIIIPIVAGISAVSILIIICLVVVPFVRRKMNLKKADKLVENGSYMEAAKIYEEIHTNEADEKYNNCLYTYAKELYGKGNYKSAISKMSSITYNDSKDLTKSWKYEYAVQKVKDEEYSDAITLFEELGEYNNSKEKLKELNNYYGIKLYNQKKFGEAITYLEDNSKLYDKVLYNRAVELHNNGEYGKAFNEFQILTKKGNAKAARIAESLLNLILPNGLCHWNYTAYNNENTLTYIFNGSYSDAYDRFYLYLVKPDGSHDNNISFKGKIVTSENDPDAKEPIVLMGFNTQKVTDVVFLTFDFINNKSVRIHTHRLSDLGNGCPAFCGIYNAGENLDFSSYTTKYEYDFEKVELPKLSFIDDVPQQESTADNVETEETNDSDANESESSQQSSTNGSNEVSSEQNTNSKITSTSSKEQSSKTTSSKTNIGNSTVSKVQSSKVSSAIYTSSKTQSSPQVEISEPQEVDECANGHKWKDITTTVHHEEVGHYESVQVSEATKWYDCGLCSEIYNDINEYYSHFDSTHTDPLEKTMRESYVNGTNSAEYEEKWVIDQEAYDETVVEGQKCEVCGETK